MPLRPTFAAFFALLASVPLACPARAHAQAAPIVSAMGGPETVFRSNVSLRQWEVKASGVRRLTVRLVRFSKGERIPVWEQRIAFVGDGGVMEGRLSLLMTRTRPETGIAEFRPDIKLTMVRLQGVERTDEIASDFSPVRVTSEPSVGMAASGLVNGSLIPQRPDWRESVLFTLAIKGGKEDGPHSSLSNVMLDDLRKQSKDGVEAFAIVLEWEPGAAKPVLPTGGSASVSRP